MRHSQFIFLLFLLISGCDREKTESAIADLDEENLPTLDEAGFVDLGRFQIFPNPIDGGMRLHILLDTSTGNAWVTVIGGADIAEMNFGSPVGWVKAAFSPPLQVEQPEIGRFHMASSYTYGADSFLLDTATGKIYTPRIDRENDSVVFEMLPVEGLHDAK